MDLIRRVVFMPTAGTGRVRGTPRAGPSLHLGSEGRLAQGGRCLSARGLGLVTGEVRVSREGAGNAEGSRLWGRPGPRVLPEGSERHAGKTPLCLRALPMQKWPSLHLQLLVQVRGLWPGLSAEGSAPTCPGSPWPGAARPCTPSGLDQLEQGSPSAPAGSCRPPESVSWGAVPAARVGMS